MNHGYSQFCPVAKATELLCERWTLIVIRELVAGSRHFNELRRGLPRMSPTLLARRLRQLVEYGVVTKHPERGGQQVYTLTQSGLELAPLIEALGIWGHRWVGSRLQDGDLDAGLLMWDIRRGVDGSCMPEGRIVVAVELNDAPEGMRQWWLVCDDGAVDLCLEDPGHEVDILVHSPLRVLTEVWMCHTSLQSALDAGTLQVLGSESLTHIFAQWFVGSSIAQAGAASLRTHPIAA